MRYVQGSRLPDLHLHEWSGRLGRAPKDIEVCGSGAPTSLVPVGSNLSGSGG